MKILFFTDNFPPEVNAIASRVYERARYWVQWGHEVTVVTSVPNFPEGKIHDGYKNKWRQVETIGGIRVVRVKTLVAPNQGVFIRTLDFLSYLVTAPFGAISEPAPDVVAATSPQFFVAIAGFIVAGLKRRPFVLEIGDLWPTSITAVGAVKPGLSIRLLEKLELFLYRRAERVVLLTKAFQRNLVSRGIQAKKLDVVRNGVELAFFKPQARNVSVAKSYGLQHKFVVGYIGTHGMAHDLSNVISAATETQDDNKIIFLFVGSGAEKVSLMERAQREAIKNVIFIPSQPKAAIPKILSICDVALVHLKNSPAMAEVIPSKIFEAMGMALPILLVSPQGEASQILCETKAGIHVPAGQPAELARAVRKMKGNPDLLKTFSANSRAAAPLYSRELQAKRYLDSLFKAIADERN